MNRNNTSMGATTIRQRLTGPALSAALLALAFGTSAGAAMAQSAAQQNPAPPPQQAQPARVSDSMLVQFAEAQSSVQTVQQDYTGKIESATDAETVDSLRQEAQDAMISAVQESGLSVTQYNMIAQELRSNPELVERMEQLDI